MSTDLIAQLQSSSALVKKGVNDDTAAVAGGAGASFKSISIKGGLIRKLVNGKEIGSTPERHLDVIFTRMAHNPYRIFYAEQFKEGEKTKPTCWSSDSQKPDANVKTPQAPACDQCKHSIKGANPGCRLQWRTAVTLPNDPQAELLQLIIPGASCWGQDDGDRRPFQYYMRFLRDHNISSNVVVTRMSYDTRVSYPRVLFQHIGAVPSEMVPVIEAQHDTPTAENYIKLNIVDREELTAGAPPAPPPPIQHKEIDLTQQAVADVAEPVLRESSVQQPQAPKADVSSIINKWSVKS